MHTHTHMNKQHWYTLSLSDTHTPHTQKKWADIIPNTQDT
jgi:hypothetical protein